jgi:hypothetical protein
MPGYSSRYYILKFNTVSVIISRRLRWAGLVAHMGEESVQGLVGKREGKRPLGRPRCRWEDGIRMDLREIGWRCGGDPVGSRQGPVAGFCKYGDELVDSGATELVNTIPVSKL